MPKHGQIWELYLHVYAKAAILKLCLTASFSSSFCVTNTKERVKIKYEKCADCGGMTALVSYRCFNEPIRCREKARNVEQYTLKARSLLAHSRSSAYLNKPSIFTPIISSLTLNLRRDATFCLTWRVL